MAPAKRKRPERGPADSGDNRPSPHRPSNNTLPQQERDGNMGRGAAGGGNRRASRGGRGGQRGGRNDRRNSSDYVLFSTTPPVRGTPGPMSPPAPRPSSSSQPAAHLQIQTGPSPSPAIASPVADDLRPDPVPYDYSHITDARVASWPTNGRQEVVNIGKQALDDVDVLELSIIFQELTQASLDRRLDAADAGNCVKEIVRPDATTVKGTETCDGSALFLDCLSIMTDSGSFDPILQKLVAFSGISTLLVRRILDAQLLEKLNLTRNTFVRTGIRQTTNLLYRQSNHNLLREETEGYSKLVTELFTTSSSEQPTGANVEEAFERIKGLIGTFDLDVGRVLDVTLDVFAAVLIKQFRFFVKFLRVSSWWPRDSGLHRLSLGNFDDGGLPRWALPNSSDWAATEEDELQAVPRRQERDRKFWDRARKVHLDAFFELGGRHVIDSETKDLFLARRSEIEADIGPDRQWIETTGTAPPPGNHVAAQLLGFKLLFYASEAREQDDVLPANLIYLSALLIKLGFISLRDLYPHLWPLDENMPALQDARMKELAEKEKASRPGGASNALMMAGALADDTVLSSGRSRDVVSSNRSTVATEAATPETEEKPKLPEPEETKVKLLINLLTIGAIPESLFILGRFPWLPEAFPEILDVLHRVLHHSINKVFEASLASGIPCDDLPLKKGVDVDQSSAPKGHVRRSDTTPRKLLRWPFPEKHDVHEANSYRFYWDEWADNIPVCQDVDDIFTLCSTLLNISGVNIGRDAALLSKLYTIGNKSLAQDRSEANLARWQELLKRLLVPALSLTNSNTNIANELYDMLRYYPLPVRYTLYAEWFEGQTSRLPAMTAAFQRTRRETLSTMKRISKANLTVMARNLAKIAYASPGIVFKVAISQIEAYSNLIEVVVECARYFTDLGYDVLIWSLLSSLGGKSRDRTRSDDVLLTSRWLIALSKFSGKAFKRYSIMNPAPVIQYINDQLYRGNATDLIILEELIAHMTGIIPDTDFTDSQLLAMTGGEMLRRQTLINLHDKRFESDKSAKRFMRSLLDTKLAAPILVSIAQHRQSAVFAVPDGEAHIKYLATIIDETQRILVQYLDLLRSNLSADQFDAIVPDTAQLITEYGLDPALAFLIGRASFSHRITTTESTSQEIITKNQPKTDSSLVDTDVEGDVNMDSREPTKSSTPDAPRASPTPSDSWREILTPLIAAVQNAVPESIWRLLSPDFYVIFWQLALSDIHLPMDSYSSENTRLGREISDILRDRSDMTRKGVEKRDEKKKALELIKNDLMKESKQQLMNYEKVRGRLNKEKLVWFANTDVKPDSLNDALLEHCFLPRLLLSPVDSDYCFKLIKFLHNNGTPHFRTLSLYSRIFKANRLRALIFSCSLREAENLGRFLKQILSDLARWHFSKVLYEKEAIGSNRDLPGFAKKLGMDHKPEIFLEYEEFRRWLFNIHKSLNIALKSCLSGIEWMHIRNAITVLKVVVEVFPAIDFQGKSFQNTLMEIGKRELNVRDDLSLTANAVLPDLKKREGKWVMPQAFATNLGESQQVNGSGKAATPQPETVSKIVLKPTAPEFKPGSSITSNGFSTPKYTTRTEVEDGEVDDLKAIKAPKSLQGGIETPSAPPHLPQRSTAPSNPKLDLPTQEEISSRDNTPKATPDVGSQPGSTSRSESSRHVSSGIVLDKPPPGLPSRPDVPFPGRVTTERHQAPPRVDEWRDGRPGNSQRDRGRDLMNSDRRPLEPSGRESGRYSERGAFHDRDRERDRHDPSRRPLEPPRDVRDLRDRDRTINDLPRGQDSNGRLGRADPMPPPRNPIADSALISPNEIPVPPTRSALLHGVSEPLRSDGRSSREDLRDHSSSRPHSPRRSDRPRDNGDGRRSDQVSSGRYGGPDIADFPRARHDDQTLSTSSRSDRGDRGGDRSMNRGPERPQRGPSAFQPTPPSSQNFNPDHGRLNDANYGRLEGPTDIPSGPRVSSGRDTRDSRVGRGRNIGTSVNVEPPPVLTPDKPPPTGPANHSQRRMGSSHFDSTSTAGRSNAPHISAVSLPPPPPLPTTPVGVHPSQSGLVLPTESAVQVNPDRLNLILQDQSSSHPPPIQTNVRHEVSAPSPMSGLAPSGPRGQLSPASASIGSNGFSAPTGPSMGPERNRAPRERQGHHLQGIQDTLTRAGQQMAPDRPDTRIRGRGNIRAGFDSYTSSSPSATLSALPTDLRDSGPERGRELINPDRKEFGTGHGPNGVENDNGRQDGRSGPRGRDSMQGHDRSHRSSRHSSHRTSRSRSPGRENQRPLRERDLVDESSRDHRGRRSEGGRDRHQTGERDGSRRDMRDGDKSREGPTRTNDPAWNADNGNGPDRGGSERAGRSRELRQSSGTGEPRRDSRSSRDADGGSGRKRRGDEGSMMERGHDKRVRR